MAVVGGLGALLVLALALAFLGQASRNAFGSDWGNYLLVIAPLIGTWLFLGVRAWRRTGSNGARSFTAAGISILFAFLAWFTSPDQISERAFTRVMDMERAIENYREEIKRGPRKGDEAERLRHLQVELAARRAELQAVDLRYPKLGRFYESEVSLLSTLFSVPSLLASAIWGWFWLRRRLA